MKRFNQKQWNRHAREPLGHSLGVSETLAKLGRMTGYFGVLCSPIVEISSFYTNKGCLSEQRTIDDLQKNLKPQKAPTPVQMSSRCVPAIEIEVDFVALSSAVARPRNSIVFNGFFFFSLCSPRSVNSH